MEPEQELLFLENQIVILRSVYAINKVLGIDDNQENLELQIERSAWRLTRLPMRPIRVVVPSGGQT